MSSLYRIVLSSLVAFVCVILSFTSLGKAVAALSFFERPTAESNADIQLRKLRYSVVTDQDRDLIYRIAINYMIERHGFHLVFCKKDSLHAARVDKRTFERRAGTRATRDRHNLPNSLHNMSDYFQGPLNSDGKTELSGYFTDCSAPGFRTADTRIAADYSDFNSYARSQLFWAPDQKPMCYVRLGMITVSPFDDEAVMPMSFACGPLYGYPGKMFFIQNPRGWQFGGLVKTGVY